MTNLNQDDIESNKIAAFLTVTGKVIAEIVRLLLVRFGCRVSVKGQGLELQYDVACGDMKATLYFRNLYLEIATLDRDADPLQFDEKLSDYTYFLSKASFVIRSKLEILLKLLKSEDVNKTIDEIYDEFKGERIFIEKVGKIRRKNGSCPNPANN
jgi:hypothetical protein